VLGPPASPPMSNQLGSSLDYGWNAVCTIAGSKLSRFK
jgi:hypothetical protein